LFRQKIPKVLTITKVLFSRRAQVWNTVFGGYSGSWLALWILFDTVGAALFRDGLVFLSLGISKGVIFNVGLMILVSGGPYVMLPPRIRAGFDINFLGRSINKYMIFAY
jgi:hypothetical protein